MSKIINDYGKNKETLKIKTKSFYDENIYIRITYTIIYNTIYVYILYIIYIYNNLIYYLIYLKLIIYIILIYKT